MQSQKNSVILQQAQHEPSDVSSSAIGSLF